MENFKITAAQISASSQFDGNYAPNYGRLHYPGTWAARVNDLHQWIQIDFRVQTTVTYVATQGRYGSSQRVTQYKLQYSNDGNSFQVFKQQGVNTDKVRMSSLSKEKSKIKTLAIKQLVSDQEHQIYRQLLETLQRLIYLIYILVRKFPHPGSYLLKTENFNFIPDKFVASLCFFIIVLVSKALCFSCAHKFQIPLV